MFTKATPKKSMSIEKPNPIFSSEDKIKRTPYIIKQTQAILRQNNLKSSMPFLQRYFIRLKNVGDDGYLYSKTFEARPDKGDKTVVLKFPKQCFTFQNVQSVDFPSIIWVTSAAFSGYIDNDGTGTQRMIGFSLKQVNSHQKQGVTLYNVTYQIPQIQVYELTVGSKIQLNVSTDLSTQAIGNLETAMPLQFTVSYLQTY